MKEDDFRGFPEDLQNNIKLTDIDGATEIRENDILHGRGGRSNHHPGNARYLEICLAKEMEYFYIESRTEKTEFSMNLVLKFRSEGIRFLEKTKGKKDIWHDVGNLKMRDKVAQRLRERMPEIKKKVAALSQQQQGVATVPVHTQIQTQSQTQTLPTFSPATSQQYSFSSHTQQQFIPQQQQQQQSNFYPQISQGQMMPNFNAQPSQVMSQQPINNMAPNVNMNMNMNMMSMGMGLGMGMPDNTMIMGSNYNDNYPIPLDECGIPTARQEQENNHNLLVVAERGEDDDPFAPLDVNEPTSNYSDHFNQEEDEDIGTIPLKFGAGNETGKYPGFTERAQQRFSGLSDISDLGEALMESLHETDTGAYAHLIGSGTDNDNSDGDDDDDNDSFEKRRSFSNRDHQNMRGSFSLPSAEAKPRSSFPSPSGEALRDFSLADAEVMEAMGGSTTSLLDYLRVDAVQEEDEDGDDADGDYGDNLAPGSPKHKQYASANNSGGEGIDLTPPSSNRGVVSKESLGLGGGPNTVTPPIAGYGATRGNTSYSSLDDKILEAWANGSGDLTSSPFTQVNEDVGAPPFPRKQPALRLQTTPTGQRSSQQRSPRKVKSGPGRAQSPTQDQCITSQPRSVSPKPPCMSKRQTSHQAETPETRHHLHYRDGPWYDLEEDFSPEMPARGDSNLSSWSSVQKVSLNRDRSVISRNLKEQQQQQQQHQYSQSLPSHSFPSMVTDTGVQAPMTPPISGKPSVLAAMMQGQVGGEGIKRQTTPRTARMMQEFDNMNLLHNKDGVPFTSSSSSKKGPPRTANSCQERVANEPVDAESLDQISMDLMVQRPPRLQWRNRTSTIEALDLDNLDDDPILKRNSVQDFKGRLSINSIANAWANTEDLEVIVADVANQKVTDLMY